jgi:hypothetical protein
MGRYVREYLTEKLGYCGRGGCASSGSTETSVMVSRTVPATIGGAPSEMVMAAEHAGQA